MNSGGIEIERKYLIRFPDKSVTDMDKDFTEIVQTYLTSEKGVSERVRKRWNGKGCTYYHTVKRHITNVTRIEDERVIDGDEYAELLKRADGERKAICKKRFCIDWLGQTFEIDVYPFYTDRAIMEIELENESQNIIFPPCIEIIREVTDDKRYTNASMAKSVPYDPI